MRRTFTYMDKECFYSYKSLIRPVLEYGKVRKGSEKSHKNGTRD